MLAAAYVVGKLNWATQKQRGPYSDVKTGQAAHISEHEGAVGELSGDPFSHHLVALHSELWQNTY